LFLSLIGLDKGYVEEQKFGQKTAKYRNEGTMELLMKNMGSVIFIV